MAALSLSVLFDASTLVIIYGGLFLLGVGETFADNATTALTVLVVPRDRLGVANARLDATFTVGNQLVGPPLGGFLFALGSFAPFMTHAVALGAAAVVATRVVIQTRSDSIEARSEPASFLGETREGLAWVRRNAPIRTLVMAILTMNIAFSAAFATWVLYATDEIGLTTAQFGLLMTCSAIGGLTAPWLYPRTEAVLGIVRIVQVGFLIEAGVHLTLALTPSAPVVAITMVLFGAHTMIWGAAALSLRQNATPESLLGRVNGVYSTASIGGSALGSALGAVIAQLCGVTAGFWGAGVVMLLIAALSRRRVRDLATDVQAGS
ncbi:hypothetical protein GCM10023169_29140 [Georgenia halophila]|uniref:MFS transporter n=2 Tax=Georgenia halophila TaxID=620889 RepID=A0ABP8LHC8_9MICO